MQHVYLIFTYDALSSESWNEIVTAYEKMRSCCQDGPLPFHAAIIAAMDEGEGEAGVSHAEAETFASQRGCRFAEFSP